MSEEDTDGVFARTSDQPDQGKQHRAKRPRLGQRNADDLTDDFSFPPEVSTAAKDQGMAFLKPRSAAARVHEFWILLALAIRSKSDESDQGSIGAIPS